MIVYFLLAGEIFLRVFAPRPILPRYVCATNYGIRGNEPSRSYWHTTPEYHINIRTNSAGMRADQEIPYRKRDGIKRVVVLGDSFGMGYGVRLEETFSCQMQNFLCKAGIRCEVVNLSVSGHGTAEELITLNEVGFRYQPDLVLLVWHGSDLADNVRANLYRLEGDRLVQASKTYLPGVKTREFLFRFTVYRWLAEDSHLYSCLREQAGRFVKYTLLPVIRRLSGPKDSSLQTSADAVKHAAAYREDLAIALLKEIRSQCEHHKASFLILDIPHRLSRTEFVSFLPTDNAAMQGFNVFCPIKLFEEYKGRKLYWEESSGHLTPLGCRIVGQELARVIMDLDLFAASI